MLSRVFGQEETIRYDNSVDPSSSANDSAACGGNPTLAVSNQAVSTAAETSSADNVSTVEVLATPGTSLALELSGCKFEVRDDSPGLRYTAPDNTTK